MLVVGQINLSQEEEVRAPWLDVDRGTTLVSNLVSRLAMEEEVI